MSTKEIEKLKEKFDKDPNSKLFLPLAEEYRKEGLLEDAIAVLKLGLEKHASYTSARVLLGKILLEKGMMDEARREFESVIKIVPDNLYAHKKLAEVYRDTGETELAIKAFKSILKLNPMDEETISNLNDIEAAVAPAAPGPAAEASEEIRMPQAAPGVEEFADIQVAEDMPADLADIEFGHSDDELNAFKDSLFGNKIEDVGEPPAEAENVDAVLLAEDDAGLSFDDLNSAVAEAEIPAFDISLAETEDEETVELVDEVHEAAMEPAADFSIDIALKPETSAEDLSDADRYVSEEKFVEAMGIYRRSLSKDPANRMVLQRVEELKALLKLLGKDKEVLIDKLNAFLEGINKGHNEFLRRS